MDEHFELNFAEIMAKKRHPRNGRGKKMKNIYLISMKAENALRVLQRVASVFSRNRINIEQLNVFAAEIGNISHLNITICSESCLVKRVIKQLNKVIEVHEIEVNPSVQDAA